MPFTTWSNLEAKMRDDYASGKWRTKSYDFDGMRKEFFTPAEFLKVFSDVEARAAAEQGDYCTRTCARAGDR
ncbi:MAG: hypothetical protein LBP61_01530 [Desulfovibrio sp.]|jgi:hypothetical protein|nr:hypothetical protein [Desulfovibrio sp.]